MTHGLPMQFPSRSSRRWGSTGSYSSDLQFRLSGIFFFHPWFIRILILGRAISGTPWMLWMFRYEILSSFLILLYGYFPSLELGRAEPSEDVASSGSLRDITIYVGDIDQRLISYYVGTTTKLEISSASFGGEILPEPSSTPRLTKEQ